MRPVWKAAAAVSALVFSLSTGLRAQLPPASEAQLQAGLTVASVAFGVEELRIDRGETMSVSITLLDQAGTPVDGAQAFVFASGGLTPQFSPLMGGQVSFSGSTPADGQILVIVRVPEGEGQFFGLDGAKQVGSLPARVVEWPVGRIEVADPDYEPYAGTSFRLHATAITTHETEHATAALAWRSVNGEIATVTSSGVASFVRPGQATFEVTSENDVSAILTLDVLDNPVEQLVITPASADARTGDVVHFDVRALDAQGRRISGLALDYTVFGIDSTGGFVYEDGTFVAENPGTYRVISSMGGRSATAMVEVIARPPAREVELISHGARSDVATSDLWVFEGRDGRDYAYTGTHADGGGERMFVWDVTVPEDVQLIDSVVVDARVVNDVKVSADASWAILTREGASNRRNGIVVLDLADPGHPTILAELTDSLTAGIHNVWINGDVVYAVNDGTSAMNILDLSDPAAPRHAGRWEIRPGDTDKTLHDVWSDGQYAYLSYWDDGLVILDVGAGTHGGTPTDPAFVSSIAYGMGNTHVAWREGDYVFLGDEIGTPDGMRGYIHVVDVSDIEQPTEVAKYEVPEAGAHNVWVENETLYIAYYQAGLRIVDVSGELRGDLYKQGREIGMFRTSAGETRAVAANSPMAWGPQPFKGYLYVSDMNSGLWVLKHERPAQLTP